MPNPTTQDSSSPQVKADVAEIIQKVDKLDHEEKHAVMQTLEMYSGPIPHPEILAQYDKIDPGAAKLIIENGVKESEHRRSLERNSLTYTRNDRRRHDWMGFAIGVLGIAAGAWLIHEGHTVVGTALSGGTIVVLVGMFLGDSSNGSKDEAKENPEQEDAAKQDDGAESKK